MSAWAENLKVTLEKTKPLPTSVQQVDDSNRSVEESEMITNTAIIYGKNNTFVIDFVYLIILYT